MSDGTDISQEAIDKLYRRLDREARAGGYNLNPDEEFTKGLVEGLLVNEARYGYWACPCRLADGEREKDLDIICPCDYRDADLIDWGACYCALYVSDAVLKGEQELQPIPERRPPEEVRAAGGTVNVPSSEEEEHEEVLVGFTWSGMPVWRCKVCGYLCARPRPPLKCPVCKADQDRFERFM
ncbi:MAG: ferredoxin-thioredoxin reductase catalytic domain-containing protein [Anaerolineae bacterium]